MDFNRVKPRHIYLVQFNPVKNCEFDREHLTLVLKKNNDRKTCIVIPLTTEKNGEGANKTNIGKISTLPTNLKVNDSYAVFDQVRTVNVSRFKPLKDNNIYLDCKIDDELFFKILDLGTSELLYDLNFDEKIKLNKYQYEKACISKAIDLAYNILKIKKKLNELIKNEPQDPLVVENNLKIDSMNLEIKDILKMGIEYTLSEAQINSGVGDIFDNILK